MTCCYPVDLSTQEDAPQDLSERTSSLAHTKYVVNCMYVLPGVWGAVGRIYCVVHVRFICVSFLVSHTP